MKNLIISVLFLLTLGILTADTTVNAGPVSGNWTSAGSPYLVMGNIVVNDGTVLNIGPSVEVIFQGTYKLDVAGQIICNGTFDEMITFTAADTLNGWSSIRLLNAGTGANQPSEFNFTTFLYGRAIHGPTSMDPLNFGGAVWASNSGTITFNNCMFRRCKSIQDGSAVFADNNTNVVMTNCTIKDCESGFFGGVYVRHGNADISNSIFLNNTAQTFGAGLYFYECTSVSVTSSHIINNSAGAVAGIYGFDSPVTIINSLFKGNATTTGLGGGLGIISGTFEVINCTFEGNSSPMGGAGFWLNSLDAPATVINTIFWNNIPNAIATTNTTYSLSYCSTQEAEGDNTNIFGDPQFTDAANGDCTLMETSPCIDAGTPDASQLGLPLFDLEGFPRIVDGDDDTVAQIDIGCYEWQVPITDGMISGYVTDNQGQPIEGAVISVDNLTFVSDASGMYTITLLEGNYSLTCTMTGYEPITVDNVVVVANETTVLDFELNPVSNDEQVSTPDVLSIANYPNPFRSETIISFTLPKAGATSLEIYNLKGQKVRSLVNENLKTGVYNINWNGRDDNSITVGSGLYLCRIKTGDRVITKRLLKK